jgi:hypothetical protein
MTPMGGYDRTLISPKLWPENACFVNGYPKKEICPSVYYNRGTTVNLPDRPKTPAAALSVIQRRNEDSQELEDLATMEMSRSVLSRPMTQQATMESSWRKRVEDIGTSSLRKAMGFSNSHERKEPMTLVDETDMLRYAGPTAMIIHSQTTEDLKFRLSLERMHSKIPYELRWRQVTHHVVIIKRHLKRNQELSDGILNLAQYLRKEAVLFGNTTTYKRVDFIRVLEVTNKVGIKILSN